MTCLETYQLDCGNNCGLLVLPVVATYTGWHWLQWEYGGTTYKKKFWAVINKPLAILYPFQSHGVWVFKLYDQFMIPIEFEYMSVTYDCFRAIGLPTYEIPAPELEVLLVYCQSKNLQVQLDGTGSLSIALTLIDNSSPLSLMAALNGTGTLDIGFTVLRILESELNGIGTLDVDTDSFTVSPGNSVPFLSDDENAFVAYSNRLLHYDYSGDCMEIERVTDGALYNVGFNSKGWRDDVNMLLFLGGADGRVKTLFNQTGLGPDWIQATAANRIYATISGNPVIVDGKAMLYHNGSQVRGFNTGSWSPANAVGTVAYVLQQFTSGTFIHLHSGAGSGQYMGYGDGTTNSHYANCGTIPAYYADKSEELISTRTKYSGYMVNQKRHIWMKGPNTNSWSTLGFGNYTGSPFKGYFGELVLWDEDKTSQRVAYSDNMMGNWGI